MSLWREGLAAMRGSVGLAKGEARALSDFNVSADGFWHSFAAFLPVLPIYLYLQQTDDLLSGHEFSVLSDVLASGVQWMSWPVVAFAAARALGLSRDYARYIIVYNWSSLPVSLFFLPSALVIRAGIGDAGLATALNLAALALALVYGFLIARRALSASAGAAVLMVLTDFIYGQLVSALVGS